MELSPEEQATIDANKALGKARQNLANEEANHATVVAEERAEWQVKEAEKRLAKAQKAVTDCEKDLADAEAAEEAAAA